MRETFTIYLFSKGVRVPLFYKTKHNLVVDFLRGLRRDGLLIKNNRPSNSIKQHHSNNLPSLQKSSLSTASPDPALLTRKHKPPSTQLPVTPKMVTTLTILIRKNTQTHNTPHTPLHNKPLPPYTHTTNKTNIHIKDQARGKVPGRVKSTKTYTPEGSPLILTSPKRHRGGHPQHNGEYNDNQPPSPLPSSTTTKPPDKTLPHKKEPAPPQNGPNPAQQRPREQETKKERTGGNPRRHLPSRGGRRGRSSNKKIPCSSPSKLDWQLPGPTKHNPQNRL
ncbi:hypothetical protein QOT17_002144 [Balamuthia mandrillaris]